MSFLEVVKGVLFASVDLFNRMSFYLLLGFLFAGILHIFLLTERVVSHLEKKTFGSVVKAALFGIPLPICSCGVIPAAITLNKRGASKGATLSFLISTPTSGVDSILATYSLMGGIFAFGRVISSFFSGMIAGVTANFLDNGQSEKTEQEGKSCHMCNREEECRHSPKEKFKGIFSYAFGVLLPDIARWLILGILVGGVISYLVPESLIENYLGSSWRAMLAMLLIGIPLYVCATGSIPIAAALMLKGMTPGAALVFLLAGPATNAVTIIVMAKFLGKKYIAVYLGSIIVSSLILGRALDYVWMRAGITSAVLAGKGAGLPVYVSYPSSLILFTLMCAGFLIKKRRSEKDRTQN